MVNLIEPSAIACSVQRAPRWRALDLRLSRPRRFGESGPNTSGLPTCPPKLSKLQLAGCQIGNHGVLPIGQLHRQAFDFAAEKLVLALHRRGQCKSLAGRPDGGGVFDLAF